ncbi:MAG TPA: PEP-CTERM sorting domain-containing protein [Terriglobia bacterium]|nr:PEP-CTERM sorting domain-containing protein [Terriglobia bacterium]
MNPLNRSNNSLYRPLLGAALLLSAAGSAAHAQSFTNIIDPLNPTFTQALGINDSNTIAGYGNGSIFNGFTLTLPSSFTRENFPGADGGTQVIGISNGASPTTVGFYVMGGVTNGFANTGGTFTTVDDPGFAFTQLLGINGGGTTAAGYWTHDATGATGQLAGIVTGGPGFTSPTFIGINHLLPANDNSQATGVNDSGWVVGFYQEGPNSSPTFTGFVDESGVVSSIMFPGATSTQALGVNDLGEIVGDYTLADGDMFGFLDKGGAFTKIDPFGSTAVTANGINDKGIIVGFYGAADGDTIGFATVPEPSTWAMMLAGFAGLGFLGYRRTLKGTLAARA